MSFINIGYVETYGRQGMVFYKKLLVLNPKTLVVCIGVPNGHNHYAGLKWKI